MTDGRHRSSDTGQHFKLARLVLIGGDAFDQETITQPRENHLLQSALMSARNKFGHALCQCRRPGLKLQIRLRDGRNFLAVWPNEGPLHAPDCIFFRDPLSESPEVARRHNSKAPAARPVASQESTSEQNQAPKPAATAVAAPAKPLQKEKPALTPAVGFAGSESNTLQLRPLLSLLWEVSSMCDWHPGWQRDWGRARYELVKAAQTIELGGRALNESLYIPRPFRPNIKHELDSEWNRFFQELPYAPDHTGIVIAPVRMMEGGVDSPLIFHLRHMKAVMHFTERSEQFLKGYCERAIQFLEKRQRGAQTPEVIGIFLVTNKQGQMLCRMSWIMPVHTKTYVPVMSQMDAWLLDDLLEKGYTFRRLLRDVPKGTRKFTSEWLLRYVAGPDGRATARAGLEIAGTQDSSERIRQTDAWAMDLQRNGVPVWTWKPSVNKGRPPIAPLPPKSDLSRVEIEEALGRISVDPAVDYRFGRTTKL